MNEKKPQSLLDAPPATRQRPLPTRKSAWKLGWPTTQPRGRDGMALQPAGG